MKFQGSKVLITQAHLVRFMGSEMVTLELAEFFANAGADVVIGTQTFGGPIKSDFDALPVRVYELNDDQLDMNLADRLPDIAWIHHSIIPRRLMRSPGETTFIFNHMSAYTAAEFTLFPTIERDFSSAVLFVSPEARTAHLATGLYDGIPQDRIQIWANPAPQRFSEIVLSDLPVRPRIAVISNHLARELIEAVDLLQSTFEFSLIGAQTEHGAKPRRITPELLGEFDAVVSIGKTIQYALVAGIPVYCYDHFGGPGWLNETNFDLAAETNFSGRGSNTRSASELASELREGFEGARAEAGEFRKNRLALYSLPERMTELVNYVESSAVAASAPSDLAIAAHDTVQSALGEYIREWVREWGNSTYLRKAMRTRVGGVSKVVKLLRRQAQAGLRRLQFRARE